MNTFQYEAATSVGASGDPVNKGMHDADIQEESANLKVGAVIKRLPQTRPADEFNHERVGVDGPNGGRVGRRAARLLRVASPAGGFHQHAQLPDRPTRLRGRGHRGAARQPLEAASRLVKEPLGFSYANRTVRFDIDLPPHAVAAVTLEFAPEPLDQGDST